MDCGTATFSLVLPFRSSRCRSCLLCSELCWQLAVKSPLRAQNRGCLAHTRIAARQLLPSLQGVDVTTAHHRKDVVLAALSTVFEEELEALGGMLHRPRQQIVVHATRAVVPFAAQRRLGTEARQHIHARRGHHVHCPDLRAKRKATATLAEWKATSAADSFSQTPYVVDVSS